MFLPVYTARRDGSRRPAQADEERVQTHRDGVSSSVLAGGVRCEGRVGAVLDLGGERPRRESIAVAGRGCIAALSIGAERVHGVTCGAT